MVNTNKLKEREDYLYEYGLALAEELTRQQTNEKSLDFLIRMIARMVAHAEQTNETVW